MSSSDSRQIWRLFLVLGFLILCMDLANSRCEEPGIIPNGHFRVRPTFVRFACNRGYSLQGPLRIVCGEDGRLAGERPICAKGGCKKLNKPEHGDIEVLSRIKAVLTCDVDFVVRGNALSYCNGYNWDRVLGTCLPRNATHSFGCDFESEDVCGWNTDLSYAQQWKRVATANRILTYRTGPRHDHTLRSSYGGHYMLLETYEPIYGHQFLVSPTYPAAVSLKTACCFRFWYFMYGVGVGTLKVFVKPHTLDLDQLVEEHESLLKWQISGNQGNSWQEHTIGIDEMLLDFQIVFDATDAHLHLGDIAIDDVQLLMGSDCQPEQTTEAESSTTDLNGTTEPQVAFEMMNCTNRCGALDHYKSSYPWWGVAWCGCHELYCRQYICCPDYFDVCLHDSTEADLETTMLPTTNATTTTTTTSTTTTTTTTTTPKPTIRTTKKTITTKTTTTTRKPITTTRKTTTPTTTARTKPTTKIPGRYTRPTTSTTTTTTKKATTTKTTTTTTKTTATTSTTPKITTTKTTPRSNSSTLPTAPAPHHRFHEKTWQVSPNQLEGELYDEQPNHSRGLLLLLLCIVLIMCLTTAIYRWRQPTNSNGVLGNVVSYRPRLAQSLKANTQAALSKIRNVGYHGFGTKDEQSTPLCHDEDDVADDDGVQFEEVCEAGNAIRLNNNVSEL